jgi:hypothetical protein
VQPQLFGVLLAELRPVAPAPVPHGSVAGWALAAIVLALVVACGVFLTSRR